MKPSEFLLSEERWTKGTYYRDKNGHLTRLSTAHSCCLMGAVRLCCNDDPDEVPKCRLALQESIGRLYNRPEYKTSNGRFDVALFNDHPGTTFDMIQAVLKGADL